MRYHAAAQPCTDTCLKILVVDDHALIREGLRQVLRGLEEDVEVFEAGSCGRAFELALQEPELDLVLLDYHLPDMSGLEALDIFARQHPAQAQGLHTPKMNALVGVLRHPDDRLPAA